jgi:hypothetical protein
MKHRYFNATSTVCAALIWLFVPVAGQVPTAVAQAKATTARTTSTKIPRTADGQPDLQGVWDFRTITPLERPKALGDKQVLSDQEAASFEAEENRRQNRDLIDPAKGGGQYPAGGVVPYNEFWYDRGNKILGSRRTSLIVDPADGRLPPRTPEGERRQAARAAEGRANQAGRPRADSYTDRPLQERCITGFNAGPPMLPGAYNNNMQIFQTPGYVAILNEMVHDARIIPLDGRRRVSVPQKHGESRGRWEGSTLVVETSNFAHETSLEGSSANMRLVERFTRVDADTLLYEFTVDQPTEWTRPWTAQVSMIRSPDRIYEYACHEGNYSLAGVLAGARADEEAAKKAQGPR